MLFSDGKEELKNKLKVEDTNVHGFFILQSNITPNTEPIHFDFGEPKYANNEINYKIVKPKKYGKSNKSGSESLF